VVQILDDRDRSRDDQEDDYGHQDPHRRFPERRAGDGDGDEEENHCGLLTGP